jgi:hypothetical protein
LMVPSVISGPESGMTRSSIDFVLAWVDEGRPKER